MCTDGKEVQTHKEKEHFTVLEQKPLETLELLFSKLFLHNMLTPSGLVIDYFLQLFLFLLFNLNN